MKKIEQNCLWKLSENPFTIALLTLLVTGYFNNNIIGLHTTTTTTNFLPSCKHSRILKLGTHLKDNIKKEFLEQNSTPPPPPTVIKLNTIAPQLVVF